MTAAVLYGAEDMKIESVDIPTLADDEVLVRVEVALTCGTDLKVWKQGFHQRMIKPPSLFGHELAGVIELKGNAVNGGFREGMRVVPANSAPCNVCLYCRKGQPNLCEDLLFNNGAYAEFIRIPARIVEKNTYSLPNHLEYRDAALAEPLACVLRGLDECHVRPGDTVAIMGLGPIGLMFVRLARKAFGARVIAIARRHEQVDRAVVLGAHEGILMGRADQRDGAALVSELSSRTDGRGADVVIEAIGQPETWELATRLVRKGGTINFFGGCPTGTKVHLDTSLLHYSEITCKATFHHTPAHMRRSLQWIAEGAVDSRHIVNHDQPLSDLPQVLHDLANRRNGQIKTAIIP